MIKPLSELVEPGWAHALADVEPTIHHMGDFLRAENAAGRPWLPASHNILRAFTIPFDHQGKGWEEVTEAAIRALNARTDADGKPQPLVAILWGRNAQSLEPLLTNAFIIKSPHPSPLSASRGFFGSKPFSRANQALVTMGADPVDWTL